MLQTPFSASAAKANAVTQADWLPQELAVLTMRVHTAQERAAAAFSAEASVLPPLTVTDEQHRQGAPLMARKDFPAVPQAHALLSTLQGALSRLGGPFKEASQRFGDMKAKESPRAEELFRAYLNEDNKWFARHEQLFPEVPGLLRFLAQNALTPFTHALTRKIFETGRHDVNSIWTYGHCPHCGSHPVMGELSGPEGVRRHVCSFCLLTYRAKRTQCPFCLEESSDKLSIFTADTEPGYLTHVCRSCKGYIKLADSRQKHAPDFSPALDDLLSITLDKLAEAEGFKRPTVSALGF